jgi:PAS domain S-box-containing protein
MRGLPLEPAERIRRALFPVQGNQFGWRVASVTVSLLSVALIALTLGFRFRSADIPPLLLLALLLTFATVVVLLSKFLFWAQKEEGQFEGAFKTTEREFQSVFETALDTILILDDQGICREANPAAEQLFGVRRRELIGGSLDRFCRDSGHFRGVWKLLLVQKFHQGDAEFEKNDGSPVFVEFTAKADCLPGQHVMILRDVTERRRAQLSLLESEERFQQMARNIQEIFWMIDAKTKKALFVNPAYETITGRSCQSLLDDPISYEDLIHPEDRVHVLAKLDEATRTGNFNEKFRILCAQGTIRWVWVRGFPVRDADGKILRLVGTALEITAQKEAEEQVAANLALAKSAWAEAEALRKATLSLTQDLGMNFVMDALLKSLEDLVPYTCARVAVLLHPLKHAESSARKFGGTAEDYLPIHNWFDESKAFFPDFRHRALRHHAEGIFLAEKLFGVAILNGDGKQVPVRYVGEQHIREDLGRIPTAQDWLLQIKPQGWMYGRRLDKETPSTK